MTDHLTPEDFFEFIDQGRSSGPGQFARLFALTSPITIWREITKVSTTG